MRLLHALFACGVVFFLSLILVLKGPAIVDRFKR